MQALFGCMHFAALRLEAAVDLHREHLVSLPDGGWGEMRLTNAEPRTGSRWTNNRQPRERHALKHRPDGETRTVPLHPELVTLLRTHAKEFGMGLGSRPFTWGNAARPIPRISRDQRQTAAQSGIWLHTPETQKRPRRASELLLLLVAGARLEPA
ncbi:hypothetical protein [Nonomuraea sp. NPDC005692]|uniref:hypothetical protein n=1 Tax=Nonomuraea sp. NPDC005692 TaxID=3157168 RepID=UPI0033C24E52